MSEMLASKESVTDIQHPYKRLSVNGQKFKARLLTEAGTITNAARTAGRCESLYYHIIQRGWISVGEAENIQRTLGIQPQEYIESPLLEPMVNYSKIAGAVYAGITKALKEAGLWRMKSESLQN